MNQQALSSFLWSVADKRFHNNSHDRLRTHLANFLAAYNFARRLKTLNGLTPH